jgi:hypothetical protein|tara:strand:- start:5800 stop:6408 length:609 start_codon:yes stop_codon:yes gene_type:complete
LPENVKKKRGRPRKKPEAKVQVQRPVDDSPHNSHLKWDGKVSDEVQFDGRFNSVEPLKTQQPGRKKPYKWNHRALQNWIMGQADPAGFLSSVMLGKEIFPVYAQDEDGNVKHIGKISADPELRISAAKTLLAKCVPDLRAVEINQTIEERKVIDISALSDNDLTTIERVLEHAVIDGDPSGENAEISEAVHSGILEDHRAGT